MQGRDILQSTVDLVQDQLNLEVCYILLLSQWLNLLKQECCMFTLTLIQTFAMILSDTLVLKSLDMVRLPGTLGSYSYSGNSGNSFVAFCSPMDVVSHLKFIIFALRLSMETRIQL